MRSPVRKVFYAATALAMGGALLALLCSEHRPEVVALECIDGPTVAGIDVSYHQGQIDWKKVSRAGIRFAFIRVSDGLIVSDPQFHPNWQHALDAHIARGAYQYFRPDQSPIAQADAMIAALSRDAGELPPAIDVEETGGMKPAQLAKQITIWIDHVRDRLGVEPIIYTSPDFWKDYVAGADMTTQGLWLAHYTDQCPRVPAPWTSWSYWQRSKTGRVPGIRGDVDLDVARAPTTTETASR
ncbi:hypothetical protein BH11MYX2_BH11MYX2_27550 [soil metagenome]